MHCNNMFESKRYMYFYNKTIWYTRLRCYM